MTKVIKVINISNKTVEVANVEIKPHKIHIFTDLTDLAKAKISAMVAVGLIRAYENVVDTNEPSIAVEPELEEKVEPKKPTRRTKRK